MIPNPWVRSENGCATFAWEALTLMSRAMYRVDVSEMGLLSFGGSGRQKILHPPGTPFTDSNGPQIMSQMHFDQDNLIQDQPMVHLIQSLKEILNAAERQHHVTHARKSATGWREASAHQCTEYRRAQAQRRRAQQHGTLWFPFKRSFTNTRKQPLIWSPGLRQEWRRRNWRESSRKDRCNARRDGKKRKITSCRCRMKREERCHLCQRTDRVFFQSVSDQPLLTQKWD